MTNLLHALQYATSVAFFGLGLLALWDWVRGRDRSRAYLALAIGLLGLVSLVGQVSAVTGYRATWLTDVSLVGFLLSGYGLVLFRHTYLPLSKGALRAVAALVIWVGIADMVAGPPSSGGAHYSAFQFAVVIAVIAVWCGCVAEPAARLWMAARRLPAVQRARIRALSAGYGGIVFVLVLAIAGAIILGSGDTSSPGAQTIALVVDLLAMATVPLLYCGFAPPRWLRQLWRSGEEEAYRRSIDELLLHAANRQAVAERGLEWATRLVGAEAGAIADRDGELIAFRGVDADMAARLVASADTLRPGHLARLSALPEQLAIVQPLSFGAGTGVLITFAGRFTPLFGADEVGLVRRYSASLTLALDRVRLSEELVQAQRAADAANQAKTDYLSRMSHELRTPLTAIIGFADLLELQGPRDDQRDKIGTIIRASSHLLSLVNDVLDIARVESGFEVASLETVDVADVIRECRTLMAQRAERREISINVDIATIEETYALSDRQRLRQVLLNLLSNAIKYTTRNTTVTVSATHTAAGRCRIAVTDAGPGIPEEQLTRLFQPFERLGAEHGIIEGTGLGLAVSKKLVEAMGGTIGVDVGEGSGNSFWIELALAPADATVVAPESMTQWRLPPVELEPAEQTVLYIEDNLSTVDLVESIFDRRPQLKLLTAMQGRLGFDLAKEHLPDLIILDLHLPDINGDEVLRQLQADPRTHHIPVVMLSADATERQQRRLLGVGATAYLTKPIRVRDVLHTLDTVLSPDAVAQRLGEHEAAPPAGPAGLRPLFGRRRAGRAS